MIEVVPFKPEHLIALELQKAQSFFSDKWNPAYGRALEECGGSYTGLVEGRPVICAGLVEQWEGRALAWALISEEAGPHFVHVTRLIRKILNMAQYRRIEAHVDCEFIQGIRWAEMLGFEVEAKMSRFTAEGRDAFLYVRFKP